MVTFAGNSDSLVLFLFSEDYIGNLAFDSLIPNLERGY